MSTELTKILYVEDDEDIAEVAMMVLEDIGGFSVTHCASGQRALETYPDFAPQLVLMDVMMPQMDGPETMGKLREAHQDRCAPFIFMTAKAQIHEQDEYRRLGALDVIVKPFDPMGLCDEIKRIWETQHAA